MNKIIKSFCGFLLLVSVLTLNTTKTLVTNANTIYIGEAVATNTTPNTTDFNQNYLLSDESFSTKKIFPTENSIQEYLDKVNSPLRNYITENARASHWIYTAANGITSSAYNVRPNLNPGMILAYLEKEQSLLSLNNYDVNNDPENRIKTAMGFGCPDNGGCSDKYKGFINQLNYASYQLQYNYVISTKNANENFRVGNTIKTLDNNDVYLTNAATAAAYRYTPHVYYSGYNLWKIMTDRQWGAGNSGYQGDINNTSGSNATLSEKYKVNFEDEVITQKPTQDIILVSSSNDNCENLFRQNWTYGSTSKAIEKLQECLITKSVFDHAVTGYFGPVTKAALQKVFSGNTNSSNGSNSIIVGNAQPSQQSSTIIPQYTGSNVIFINNDPKPSTPTNFSIPGTNNCNDLKSQNWVYGTTNSNVEKLQKCMQIVGVFNHKYGATGYFGDVTKKALDSWRKLA